MNTNLHQSKTPGIVNGIYISIFMLVMKFKPTRISSEARKGHFYRKSK